MQCDHDLPYVLNRVEMLRKENREAFLDRYRTQMILDGGPQGIYAVMAWDMGKGSSSAGRNIARQIGVDLPTVNLMASGMDRLAQKIGRPPTLKPPFADDDDVRKQLQKRIDLLEQWESDAVQELTWPQLGRWLPGYGFGTWVLKQRRNSDGDFYPVAELRDSFDVFPGFYGATQQPQDMFVSRKVPLYALKRAYPEKDWITLERNLKEKRVGRGVVMHTSRVQTGVRTSGWEGDLTGLEVCEYHASCGTHVAVPELETQLTTMPNVLDSGPMFHLVKRFAFNKLINQYHHVIGLQAMMAKLNILGLVASEDSVFRETNIFGELESGTYHRGRKAVNVFDRQARVEKPTSDNLVQTWNQIDRLERQMRIGSNYDVQQDGTSPNSFATGRGMIELQGAVGANVREYHTVIGVGARRIDAMRLEMAEKLYGSSKRKFYDMYGKQQNLQVKTVIKGDYRTRRVYGAMATFDDHDTVIVGLQLLGGGVIDVETFQENLDGLSDHNITLINERNKARRAAETLYQRLMIRSEQDPKADAALAEIMRDPKNEEEILLKYFTPQEPEMTPEEQAALAQMQAQAIGGGGQMTPEPVSTVMSRIESGQRPEAGVQTAGRLG